jgi:hypothetical protein
MVLAETAYLKSEDFLSVFSFEALGAGLSGAIESKHPTQCHSFATRARGDILQTRRQGCS